MDIPLSIKIKNFFDITMNKFLLKETKVLKIKWLRVIIVNAIISMYIIDSIINKIAEKNMMIKNIIAIISLFDLYKFSIQC